jgi:hypothetical protein
MTVVTCAWLYDCLRSWSYIVPTSEGPGLALPRIHVCLSVCHGLEAHVCVARTHAHMHTLSVHVQRQPATRRWTRCPAAHSPPANASLRWRRIRRPMGALPAWGVLGGQTCLPAAEMGVLAAQPTSPGSRRQTVDTARRQQQPRAEVAMSAAVAAASIAALPPEQASALPTSRVARHSWTLRFCQFLPALPTSRVQWHRWTSAPAHQDLPGRTGGLVATHWPRRTRKGQPGGDGVACNACQREAGAPNGSCATALPARWRRRILGAMTASRRPWTLR